MKKETFEKLQQSANWIARNRATLSLQEQAGNECLAKFYNEETLKAWEAFNKLVASLDLTAGEYDAFINYIYYHTNYYVENERLLDILSEDNKTLKSGLNIED